MDTQISRSVITTLSGVNQTAVPSAVRKTLKLKKGAKIIWEIDPHRLQVHLKPAPENWTEYFSGIGQGVYGTTKDIDKYLNDLRQDRNFDHA